MPESIHSAPLILLASKRPAVRALFERLADSDQPAFSLRVLPTGGEAGLCHLRAGTEALAAVVDTAPDPETATELCRELAGRWPPLPVIALLCCGRTSTPAYLEALLAAGVKGALDMLTPEEEILNTVQAVVRGGAVLHARFGKNGAASFGRLFDPYGPGRPDAARPRLGALDRQLIELVAQGHTDQEIGKQAHLARDTVHHHLDGLYRKLGVRNRTELAAWAGRHGLYQPQRNPESGR
jgi:DNA-binding NarL/FixJ family response regulator